MMWGICSTFCSERQEIQTLQDGLHHGFPEPGEEPGDGLVAFHKVAEVPDLGLLFLTHQEARQFFHIGEPSLSSGIDRIPDSLTQIASLRSRAMLM